MNITQQPPILKLPNHEGIVRTNQVVSGNNIEPLTMHVDAICEAVSRESFTRLAPPSGDTVGKCAEGVSQLVRAYLGWSSSIVNVEKATVDDVAQGLAATSLRASEDAIVIMEQRSAVLDNEAYTRFQRLTAVLGERHIPYVMVAPAITE